MITSTFYDTTPGNGVKETEWGKSARSRGHIYGVAGESDLELTAHASTPYTVNIAPGTSMAERYVDRLPKASIGKSCVRFRKLADLDEKALVALIKETAKTGLDA